MPILNRIQSRDKFTACSIYCASLSTTWAHDPADTMASEMSGANVDIYKILAIELQYRS